MEKGRTGIDQLGPTEAEIQNAYEIYLNKVLKQIEAMIDSPRC